MTGPTDGETFDRIYRAAGRNPDRLGWTRAGPDPMIADWVGRAGRAPGTALVVACGLGDDAELLASAGWQVTAFDISPTAIEWCMERFPGSSVTYVTADLFDLPAEWRGGFDLVAEVWTIQSLSPQHWHAAIGAIAALVAPAGTLLVSALTTTDGATRSGPPWPVHPNAFEGFLTAGLAQTRRVEHSTRYPSVALVEIEYTAPVSV